MKYLLIFTIFCTTTGFAQTRNLMDYYFPVMDLTTARTYVFVDKKDTSNRVYWTLKTELFLHDTVLSIFITDKNGQTVETSTEAITSTSSRFLTDTMYSFGSTGKQLVAGCKIHEAQIFNGKQKVDATIKWGKSYKDFETRTGCKLTKERTLISVEKGLATFRDDMTLTITDQDADYKYKIESVYKKGQGLIEYKVSGGKAKTIHYIRQN